MKLGSTLFLKVVIVFMAIGVFLGLLWYPQTEGRATNLDLVSIYKDPFIIYIYLSSTLFFVGLYQAFKLLNLIEAGKAFSQEAVKTLKNMKFASLNLIGLIALAVFYIRFAAHGDDPAGPTALGIIATFTLTVIAATADVAQKLLQNTIEKRVYHSISKNKDHGKN